MSICAASVGVDVGAIVGIIVGDVVGFSVLIERHIGTIVSLIKTFVNKSVF